MLSWRILPLPLAIALLLGMHASAQSLSGLRVGDDLSSTARLGLSPVERNRSGPFTITKWRLPDGNELSVTAGSNGKIVYIESDWVRSPSGTYSDFPGLYFGRTSLTDIRQKFGSNGFAYGGRTVMRAPDKSQAE